MAFGALVRSQPQNTDAAVESDYGSDIDNDAWDAVFSQNESQSIPTLKIEDVDEPLVPDDAEPQTHSLRLARVRETVVAAQENLQEALRDLDELRDRIPQREAARIEYEFDEKHSKSFSGVETEPAAAKSPSPTVEESPTQDERSPLQRFRTSPKKPLSVTDLVSPAWCELQYLYSLTKYGRVKRTTAMKKGSKIHKQIEQEVHTEVPVETASAEDRFGLRLWNIIQGLRTLRTTGLTRELEVMGIVDGNVIIGVIDEVSYYCPDVEAEAAIVEAIEAAKGGGKQKTEPLPADQRKMDDFFASSQAGDDNHNNQSAWLGSMRRQPKTIYLADIKTRNSKSLPKLGSQMRPTQMQLMLYRRLLNNLAANEVEAETIFQRYNVDPRRAFSDPFIAALGGIDFSASQGSQNTDEPPAAEQDPLEEILGHKTLSSLWALMIAEFAKTISVTPVSSSVSPLLTAEFRASNDGSVIGRRSFAYEQETLDRYVQDEMQWWKGERGTKGVDVEEAYKCRICEFAEGCEWRISKVEEATTKARARNARKSSAVASQM